MADSIVFIDTDILCYKLGFVGQKDSVETLHNDVSMGTFKNKTEARDYLSSIGIDVTDDVSFTPVVDPKPWEQVVAIGKAMIRNIVEASGCDSYRLYIDGGDNFRNKLATIKPYKGTRVAPKPYWFTKIKEWFIDELGAVVINDIEVDDAISIATSKGFYKDKRWVGATIDKDALQTEGWLFNWDKMTEPVFIEPLDGARSLWKQMLTGDTVDNIQGCRGVAAKSSLLTDITNCTNEQDMYKIVRDQYFKVAKSKGSVLDMLGDELTPLEEMRENLALLYMFREKPRYIDGIMVLESDTKLDKLEEGYNV